MILRIGQGYDVHRLVKGLPLVIGGVIIPYDYGLIGHSDADVLLHACIDALLGALSLGDIGSYFPDTDKNLSGISSKVLLNKIVNIIQNQGWNIINIDSTLIAQVPKFLPYIKAINTEIALNLNMDTTRVNVKAKTNEKLGYLGRAEAIEAQVIVLLQRVSSSTIR